MTTNNTENAGGVTQEDREAAASYGQRSDWDKGYILSGKADDLPTVQSFAKHRIAARQAALEEAAKVADDIARDADLAWQDWSDDFDHARGVGIRQVATAIRTLSTKEVKG